MFTKENARYVRDIVATLDLSAVVKDKVYRAVVQKWAMENNLDLFGEENEETIQNEQP